MSVKRLDLVRYLGKNEFNALRECAEHSIYTNRTKTTLFKRYKIFDRVTANELCKPAGLDPVF